MQDFMLPGMDLIETTHLGRRIACHNRSSDKRADATRAEVAPQSLRESGNSQSDGDRKRDNAASMLG
jgi:hypothetical protein